MKNKITLYNKMYIIELKYANNKKKTLTKNRYECKINIM